MKIVVFLFALVALSHGRPTNIKIAGSTRLYNPTANPLICYFTNWAQYRPGSGRFTPSNIDPMLCSIIPYAFVDLVPGPNYGIQNREWNEDTLINEIMSLKTANPDLKVTVAIGGWNAGSTIFSNMVETDAGQNEFVKNVLTYMDSKGFDGVDLDWEYPANREGSRPEDKERFTSLVSKFKAKFDERKQNGDYKLLTAAVAAGRNVIDTAYQIDQICSDLDYVHVMTYDYHGAWSTYTDHNSPLTYGSVNYPNDSDLYYYNMNATAQYYLNSSCPLEKIVLGVPTYGRSFTLVDSVNDYGYNATASGPGTAGTYTREAGMLSYYEICSQLADNGVVDVWSDAAAAPVIVNEDQWISYDDHTSIDKKLEYAKNLGVVGAMVWSLALDDFNGECGRKNDLIRSIYETMYEVDNSNLCHADGLTCIYDDQPCQCGWTTTTTTTTQGNEITTTTTTATTTTTQGNGNSQTTTASGGSSGEFSCDGRTDGNYPDPTDNTIFHQCSGGKDNVTSCPSGLVYNPTLGVCDWP